MAATPIAVRLAIRDEADTADELLISSVPTDEHPYVTEPPSIDGAKADLIDGTVDVGSATMPKECTEHRPRADGGYSG